MENKFQNLIFDLDGTITNTLPLICEAFNHVINPYSGRYHPDEEIYSYFGPPEEEIIAMFLPPDQVDKGLSKLYQYYIDNTARIRPYDGIKDIFDVLVHKKINISLFTGKSRRGTEITLKQLYLTDRFSYIITGNDVDKPKPDPEGVIKLISMSRANPDTTLFIGDTNADIQAGIASGVKTGLALWGGTQTNGLKLKVKPDYLFSKVSEIIEIL